MTILLPSLLLWAALLLLNRERPVTVIRAGRVQRRVDGVTQTIIAIEAQQDKD